MSVDLDFIFFQLTRKCRCSSRTQAAIVGVVCVAVHSDDCDACSILTRQGATSS